MNIIIVGGGIVGEALAKNLEAEKEHNITIVESNQEVAHHLASKLDVLLVNGTGTSAATMAEAGIQKAHMVVAVTRSDERNVLICHLASQYPSVTTRVARIRSGDFNSRDYDLRALGVTDRINPEQEVSDYILEHLFVRDLISFSHFSKNDIRLYKYEVPAESPIANRQARELPQLLGTNRFLQLAIYREGATIVPFGETEFLPGDRVLTLLPGDAVNDFRRLFRRNLSIGKTIITGSSKTAENLALKIENHCKNLTLISEDRAFCNAVSRTLKSTTVLHGDPADTEVLAEAGIDSAEFFVPVDRESEDNIIAGLLAKADGAGKVIAITNQSKHSSLFRELGIDTILRPSDITTHKLFTEITGFAKNTIFYDEKSALNVDRIRISQKCGRRYGTVKELKQSNTADFIVCGILQDDSFHIAHGDTKLVAGSEIIVSYHSKAAKKIQKIFAG
ncbi:MAG: NAD-binding protein [Fibrobacterota bacterium]